MTRRARMAAGVAVTVALAAPAATAPAARPRPTPRVKPRPAPLVELPLAARVDGLLFAHPIMSAFVLPGADVDIAMVAPPHREAYELTAAQGKATKTGPRTWTWRAPTRPGSYELEVNDPGRERKLTLHVFVMVPFREVRNGRLNGYRIGEYPRDPPKGFVEVTADNDDTLLTPHFRLKQFVCKQAGGFPKYVVLEPTLLLKLETVRAAVEEAGFDVSTLHVMSGYRTPFYNASIENVKLSQHVWGSAADVFVDKDENGTMDDLDGDGQISKDDARVLFGIVDRMDRARDTRFPGGLGAYGGTRAHGPFVHIDVRGRLARW